MEMRMTTVDPKLTPLVDRLRKHYGHHFTTTRNGIVTGEHSDFTRHPLVGEAIAEIEQWEKAARAVVEAHDAAMKRLGEQMLKQGLTSVTIPAESVDEFASIDALRKLLCKSS